MSEERKRDLPVFSQGIAAHLMLRGHRLLAIARNYKYIDKTVFYFRDNQDVRNDIEEIKEILANTKM